MLIQSLVGRLSRAAQARREQREIEEFLANDDESVHLWHQLPPSAPRGSSEIYYVKRAA